jgi:hypothetical protein
MMHAVRVPLSCLSLFVLCLFGILVSVLSSVLFVNVKLRDLCTKMKCMLSSNRAERSADSLLLQIQYYMTTTTPGSIMFVPDILRGGIYLYTTVVWQKWFYRHYSA